MYKILIFGGGTGSIALQKGFSQLFGNDKCKIDIVINAYDNGKSTGECRKVFNNKILGPSDLRKNHMTQYYINYGKQISDTDSEQAQIYKLFNLRLSADTKEEYYDVAYKAIVNILKNVVEKRVNYLISLLDFFFFTDKKRKQYRYALNFVNFHDFSIANIFYSSCTVMNEGSLRKAGKVMTEFLKIEDNVHLISDKNLYLNAVTKTGYWIEDEEEIVNWNNSDDRIVKVVLVDERKEYLPCIDENIGVGVPRISNLINEADILIFSSGTQWSSLIPTYMHKGFRECIEMTKAKKYLVMNNIEDKDMCGVSANEILEILKDYINLDTISIIVNDDAEESMRKVVERGVIHGNIGEENTYKHDAEKLVKLIMKDFFKEYLKNENYIFDLDGTLWDEKSDTNSKSVGIENINMFPGIIVSGNSRKHIKNIFSLYYTESESRELYSDFGNLSFSTDNYEDYQVLQEQYIVDCRIAEDLNKMPEFHGKVTIRGQGCVITIKPLENRKIYLKEIQEYLKQVSPMYMAIISGKTSIDIIHFGYGKAVAVEYIIHQKHYEKDKTIFIGNELLEGNEVGIKNIGIKTLQVKDIYECNVYLKVLKFVKQEKE